MKEHFSTGRLLVAVLLCATVIAGGAVAVDSTPQTPQQMSLVGPTDAGTTVAAVDGLNATNTTNQSGAENQTAPQNTTDRDTRTKTTDNQTSENSADNQTDRNLTDNQTDENATAPQTNATTTTQPVESNTSVQSSQPEGENTTTAAVATNSSSASAIGTRLQQQLAETETQQSSGPVTADTAGTATPPETTIEFYIKPNRSTAAAAAIEARGGTVSHSFDRLIRADVPIPAVERIVTNETVRFARKPAKPIPTDVVSEGVGLTNADELHDQGIKGDGVTVAVFDLKFNPDNPEISDQVVAQWGDSGGYSSATDLHGTASAEVVADIAPEANLILVPTSGMSIYDALDKVESTGRDIDVITMSLGYAPNEPLDGSDRLSQEISSTIQKESISWSNSAGNDAVNHWNGTYEDDGSGYMEFSPSIGSEFEFEGDGEPVFVNWNAWDESTKNKEGYDVEIVDGNGDVVRLFNQAQPYVYIPGSLNIDGYAIKIKKTSASKNHRFDILAWGQHGLEYTTPESSISRPATSSNVITVAAVDTNGVLQDYSSRGPTIDGRQGIDVAATTDVSNSVYGSYGGTSAAAPHVGGTLALLNQVAPNATPAERRSALESTARGIGDNSVARPPNTAIGHGYISVPAATAKLNETVLPINTGEFDGEGTKSDPYEIANLSQLRAVKYDLHSHYELIDDIDANETHSWNGRKGFEPIGTDQPFTKSFDGNNHSINNLTINRPAESNVGLFGQIDKTGHIKRISVQNVKIAGKNGVGGLVGSSSGKITQSQVTGTINGSDGVGGLVGLHEQAGNITRSHTTGMVNGSVSVGGLIGGATQSGNISKSYATANVDGTEYVGGLVGSSYSVNITSSNATSNVNGSKYVGGLTGWIREGIVIRSNTTGVINGSYRIGGLVGAQNDGILIDTNSSGIVNGSDDVGGLLGYQDEGDVTTSYATGTVNGSDDVGGLLGYQYNGNLTKSYSIGNVEIKEDDQYPAAGGLVGSTSGESGLISESYASGTVHSDENGYIGGLVGYNSDTSITNSYWDTETSEQLSSDGGVGLTTEQMIGESAVSNLDGFDFTTTWRTRVGDYPELIAQPESGQTGDIALNLSALNIADQGATATIGEDKAKDVNVTVENIGDGAGQFYIDLAFNETVVATTATPEIAPDDNVTITFSGETDSLPLGTHSVNITNELGNYTNGTIEVKEPANFIVDVDADTVGAGDNITAEVNITNTGGIAGTQEITTSDGTDTFNTTSITLNGGASTNISVDRETTADDIGTVTLTAASENDSATTQVSVTPPKANVSELNISESGATAAIGEGDNATITADVRNLGEVAYDFPVGLKLNGTEVRSTTRTIPADATESVTFTSVTEDLPVNTHNVNVTTTGNYTTGTLTVEQPAVFNTDIDTNPVSAGNNITAEVNITNTGDRAGSTTVEISDGKTTLNTTTISLDSGESTNITVDRETTADDIGTVSLTAASDDDDATTQATVTPPTANVSELNISGAGSTAAIGSGDNTTITANVSNLGEVAYDFPVTLKLNGSAVRSTTATISPNTNKTVNFTGVTEQLPIDAHDVNVTTPSNHTTGTLTVEQPAVFTVDVDADAVSAGNNITAEVNITNTGDRTGNAAIETSDDGTTLNMTTVSLDSGASTNITVERETAVADIGTVNLTSTSPDTTATTTVTVTDPEPPNVTAVQRNVTATNDTVQINATFENGSVPIEDARIELVADFTTFTKSVIVETPAEDNADNQTTFDVTGLPADGNYTPKAVAVGPVGQTDTNTTAPVTVDTTPPELQLATTNLTADSNLRIEPSEPVTVSDNGISIVNKTGSDRSPDNEDIPSQEFTESKTVPFDGTVTGDNETFTVSVDATDSVGNTVTQNLTATVTNYTVSEDGTGVVTPTDDTTISVEADASEVDEEKAKTASVQRSSTAPTGTNLNSSQVGAGFVNVSDIGLTESELEQATINISLGELDQQAVSSFDNSSLRIFKSEDGDRTYRPVETSYNDDTHTVTATVDGFSQFSVTGVDSTKPSVTNTDIDPGRTVEPTSGPVNISYEYTDSETGINLAETTLTADVDGTRNTTNVMADTAWIEIDQLTDGESITVELNITDNAGNSRTKTDTISVETANNDDGSNDDGGSSGGGGGGGGGLGGGGGGGSTQSGPPTFEQIHSTLSLVPTESETNIELTDQDTDDSRLTIEPSGTDSVSRIHFKNQELSGQTKITDYGEPPATIKDDIKYSAANDISTIDATTNDNEVVSSNINIISLTDIEPDASATEDQSATVELVIPKSAVENPDHLSVIKEEYVFSEQKTKWVTVETTVSENEEQYVLEGDVDKFSLFAVTEVSDGTASAAGTDSDDSTGSSNDISPSVVLLFVVLVVTVVIAMIRIRR